MAENSDETILRFKDVSLAFVGVPALTQVSFAVTPGETRIVFGAAGSGKSVMLKVATGLLRPDSGEVHLLGNEISRLDEEDLFEIRGKVGVLFQEGGLFDSLNIEENVAYPLLNERSSAVKVVRPDAEEVSRRVRDALGFVELEHTLEKFPSELSGGMRRRVGIARATVKEPPLMLYDSPTAGLDPITANTIMALIAKARDTRNTTSIIVTHRYQDGHIMANFRYNPESSQLEPAPTGSSIRERTTFMVFREGKLVFEGTQEELERAQDRYVAKFKAAKP
jgi:phospholipid/cholesterol/gamma-HCH transport system ATP-binding protein